MGGVCGPSLFGTSNSNYIKVGNGEFLAVEGTNLAERLGVSDLRMPYKQLLKSRIILKPGQTNYLLNFLGLGDNATFLAIKSIYDSKSVIAEDNYINYSYYDDLTKIYSFAQMMVLTGTLNNRIKQLYLTNPNTKYSVQLEVMVGVIDDNYSIFNDTLNQSGTSFVNLEYTDIKSHIVGESIVINDKSSPVKPLIYIILTNIQSIEKLADVLVVDDASLGTIFLQFKTTYDANQAHSLISYILENDNVDIDTISPLADDEPPVIYFYEQVGGTSSGYYISFNGATGSAYDTSFGVTFSTEIPLSTYGGSSSVLYPDDLIDILIDYTEDDRDGLMQIASSNLIITGTSGQVSFISQLGTYSLTFEYSDIAQNSVNAVLTLNITT
jgi:hypothetical protein